MTLVQLKERRVKLLRAFRRYQRALDSKVEILERTLGRMIDRKRKIPDFKDLERIIHQTYDVVDATDKLVFECAQLSAGFRIE